MHSTAFHLPKRRKPIRFVYTFGFLTGGTVSGRCASRSLNPYRRIRAPSMLRLLETCASSSTMKLVQNRLGSPLRRNRTWLRSMPSPHYQPSAKIVRHPNFDIPHAVLMRPRIGLNLNVFTPSNATSGDKLPVVAVSFTDLIFSLS